jgi:hypothetical protein
MFEDSRRALDGMLVSSRKDARLMLAVVALLTTLLPWLGHGGSAISPFIAMQISGNLGLELGSMLAYLAVAALFLSAIRSRNWEMLAFVLGFVGIAMMVSSISFNGMQWGMLLEIGIMVTALIDGGEWLLNG